MSRLIKGSIDVTKIKKEHIFEGKKGQYINVDIWIDDEPDQYGNDAGIKQSYKVGDKFESHYIGNGKKGFGWDEPTGAKSETVQNAGDFEKEQQSSGDLPF